MNLAVNRTDQQVTLMGLTTEELIQPFGLVLGTTRIRDIEREFVITCEQGRGFTGGPVVQVISRYVESPATECTVLAFDDSGKLDAAFFTIPADQYEQAVSALSAVFELVDMNSPIKGSESALFKAPGVQVALHSPLFSKEMTIGYRTEKFNNARMANAADLYE